MSEKIFEHIGKIEFDEIIDTITSNDDFNEWFISANDEQKDLLYDWIGKNNTKTREAKLGKFVSNMPVSLLEFAQRRKLFLSLVEKEINLNAIALFKNLNGDFKPIKEMALCDNPPQWLYPYIINKEEYFDELSNYLIPEENYIEDIVWKHKDEFEGTIGDFYNENKWTDEKYTERLIDQYRKTEKYKTLIPIVSNSRPETRVYFLNRVSELKLEPNTIYKSDSYEYQVLQLVLSDYENPSSFSSRLFYDNKCIKDYTVEPVVKREYYSGGEKKYLRLKLADILPQYQNQTKPIEEIKNLFEPRIKDLDKFFENKEKFVNDIYNELKQIGVIGVYDKTINIYNNYLKKFQEQTTKCHYWENPGPNASQYLFGCSFGTALHKIDDYQVKDEFAQELMQILYDNKVEIKSAQFIRYIYENYLKNKYFDCDYILDEERLMPAIEQWAANDEKKREYLLENGVKNESSPAIQFRKLFLNNTPINFFDDLSDEEVESGIKYIATADNLTLPFEGENQKKYLLSASENCKILSVEWDVDRIKSNAKEWNTQEYNKWKEDGYIPQIFTYPGKLPSQLLYEDIILLNYENSDNHYYYDKEEKHLFVSDNDTYNVLLFEVVKEAKTPFELNDYEILKGEMYNVPKEEYATFEKYKEHKKEFEEYLKQIENKEKTNPPTKPNDENGTSDMPPQDPIVTGSGQSIGTGNVSEPDRPQINRDARIAAKKYLVKEGYDCSEWDAENSGQIVKDVVKLNGEPIVVVVISSNAGKLHLHPYAFGELMESPKNLLLNYRDGKICALSFDEIFKDNPDVNLIFDADIISPKEFAFISNRYRYSQKTCFVVENSSYSYSDELKGFGLHETKDEKVSVNFSIEDIFDL